MDDVPRTLLITCGALAKDIVSLVQRRGWEGVMDVECLPAHLHNTPARLPEAVRAKIRAARASHDRILVLYADCGTGGALDAVLEEEGVERVPGAHCYEVFAGSEPFREMMAQEPGSYFLTDFLARHFRRLVYQGLGLDRFPKLRSRYFKAYRKVVYLAQSDDPEILSCAQDAAESLGLPLEVRNTGTTGYERFLVGQVGGGAPEQGSSDEDGGPCMRCV